MADENLDPGAASPQSGTDNVPPTPKTYTEQEKDRLINSAIETNSAKWQAKLDELAKQLAEVKTASLSADEQRALQEKQEKEATAKTIADLQRQVAESQVRSMLAEKGLPVDPVLVSAYAAMSEEARSTAINSQAQLIADRVKSQVDEALKKTAHGSLPTTGIQTAGADAAGYKPYNIFS